jgi:hypothetical protein
MKTMFSLSRHHYLARVSIFLIMIVLIAGTTGCDGGDGESYTLIITSTAGGSVTNPGEGTFTYNEGTMVGLVAEVEESYYFVKWTGDVGTIGDVNAVETTIAMNGHYSITANFVPDGFEAIWDWYDLDAIRDNLSCNYTLMNDLSSTTLGYEELASETANEGKGWQSIGNFTLDVELIEFTGTFDGQGYKIRDLFINRLDEPTIGLFGWVGEGGVIKNIGVLNASVTGHFASGLVGVNCGIVSNSYSTATVTGDLWTGGLVAVNGGPIVGTAEGTVTNCYSSGLTAHTSGTGGNQTFVEEAVGGLVGINGGAVSNSYSTATVTGDNCIGGLVGINGGAVSNSYSTATVTGEEAVGGLVGANYVGTLSNCYSTGSATGNSSVGGLVGWNDEATVDNSFWDTETSGQATSDGGTGKTTAQMQDIITFSGATWDIVAVANPSIRNLAYIWNIVDDETYPFLSWES